MRDEQHKRWAELCELDNTPNEKATPAPVRSSVDLHGTSATPSLDASPRRGPEVQLSPVRSPRASIDRQRLSVSPFRNSDPSLTRSGSDSHRRISWNSLEAPPTSNTPRGRPALSRSSSDYYTRALEQSRKLRSGTSTPRRSLDLDCAPEVDVASLRSRLEQTAWSGRIVEDNDADP